MVTPWADIGTETRRKSARTAKPPGAAGFSIVPAANIGYAVCPDGILQITQQPVGATIADGDQVTFTVAGLSTESGTINGGLTFQWQSNGVNIASATSSNYTTGPLPVAASGVAYRALVTSTVKNGTLGDFPVTLASSNAIVMRTVVTVISKPTDLPSHHIRRRRAPQGKSGRNARAACRARLRLSRIPMLATVPRPEVFFLYRA